LIEETSVSGRLRLSIRPIMSMRAFSQTLLMFSSSRALHSLPQLPYFLSTTSLRIPWIPPRSHQYSSRNSLSPSAGELP
jgi:hypothetical protein